MLAKKKAESIERVRLRCDAAEREALRLGEEEQWRRKREDIAHARSEFILGKMTNTETRWVKDFIQSREDDNHVLVKLDQDSVKVSSAHTLQPGEWLNDKI